MMPPGGGPPGPDRKLPEADLRAALHAGEHSAPGVDVDAVVRAGRARARRRTAVLIGSAAAVVVLGVGLGVGVGVGVHTSGGSAGSPQAARPASVAAPAARAPAAGRGPSSSGDKSAAPTAGVSSPNRPGSATCPAAWPQLDPRDGAGPLFAAPVTSVVLCAYGTAADVATGHAPATLTLSGPGASAFVASIESASTRPVAASCPAATPAAVRRLAFIGVTADGRALPPISTSLDDGCPTIITNGTATRYGWSPPVAQRDLLSRLRPESGRVPSTGRSRQPPIPR